MPSRKGDPQRQQLRQIGINLRHYREAEGLSQEQLAELADIHDRTVGTIERGELNFSVGILIKLCKALNLSPGTLFSSD